jgi:hypothetical protein
MAQKANPQDVKGRRISIDLTPDAAREVDRLRERLGVTTADLFRYSLHLMHLYVTERDRGKSLYVADSDQPDLNRSRIELALFSTQISAATSSTS